MSASFSFLVSFLDLPFLTFCIYLLLFIRSFDSRNSQTLDAVIMADSDRSRSPTSTRNRGDQRGQETPARPGLPFFPRWVAPMQTMVWPSSQMPRPQYRPQCIPQVTGFRPGPHMMHQSMGSMNPLQQNTQSPPCFPPTPPSIPPTLPYPIRRSTA